MGKGDKKSKKGKMAIGSFGNSRPQKPKNEKTTNEAQNRVNLEKK